MNTEQLITTIPCANKPELSELRRSLLSFRDVSKLDGHLVLEAAQRIVDAARSEIVEKLDGSLNGNQVRYFREVIKTVRHFAGERLEIPEYEVIADPNQIAQVILKEGSR